MSDPVASLTARLPARSMGLKLLLVCLVAFVMSLVALSVWAILIDRTNRADKVGNEISDLIGGPQSFVGPIVAIPYTLPAPPRVAGQPTDTPGSTTGVYVVFPEKAAATAKVKTEVRHRGIFSAPVWTSDLAFTSSFDLTGAGAQAPKDATLDWSRAEILVGASNARGAQSDVVLTAQGKSTAMVPALTLSGVGVDNEYTPRDNAIIRSVITGPTNLRFFGARPEGLVAPGAKFEISASMRYAGAKRLAVYAFGRTTTFEVQGDWSDPSYDGGFLPVRKNFAVAPQEGGKSPGFSAAWSVPFIARGVAAEGTSDILTSLGPTSLGVSFVEQANPYQSVSRSLKYASMFIGLVFLAYFLFETTQHRRVHPAQYVLIGLAQIIFYMLLLSIAERLGFDAGFAIAAAATVALISAYAGWVFESRKQGFIALGAFSALYGLIYVLMRLEDLALLVGAVASFAAIAAVMYFTRRIDWYGQAGQTVLPAPSATPDATPKA